MFDVHNSGKGKFSPHAVVYEHSRNINNSAFGKQKIAFVLCCRWLRPLFDAAYKRSKMKSKEWFETEDNKMSKQMRERQTWRFNHQKNVDFFFFTKILNSINAPSKIILVICKPS